MSELKLNSKLIHGCDYHEVDISEFAIPLKADPSRSERDIRNFLKALAKKEEVSEVAMQDMVTLSCSSDNPKFQKDHLTVRIGLGLYSKELETKLIGMTLGEEKTLTVGGDAVRVSVERIVREIIPELTDELAKQSGLPDIRTAEDVRTYCRFKQYDELLEDPADEAFSYLAGYVVKNSAFDLDEKELAMAQDFMLRSMNGHRLLDGKPLSEVTDEEITQAFGISKQDMIDNMNRTGAYTLKAAVLGQNLKVFDSEDYEAYLNKRAIALQRSVEDILQRNVSYGISATGLQRFLYGYR